MKGRAEEAVRCFKDGFNCSQAVFTTFCGEFGLDKKQALALACGLGGGMGRQQETCGAVSGAYLLIGLKYGKVQKEDDEAKEHTYALVREFARRFKEMNGTTSCRELLGVDLIDGNEQIKAERVKVVCPKVIRDAAGIVESMLFE